MKKLLFILLALVLVSCTLETPLDITQDVQGNGGYNVVPKTLDPWNAYDIAEVQAYAQGQFRTQRYGIIAPLVLDTLTHQMLISLQRIRQPPWLS